MNWIEDIFDPKVRRWEEFYRNRWQHDKVIRSTHGVNCTGGCSWNIHVKQGIVTWEMQALDYPLLNSTLPPYEPRGCQRGISFSWYLYSPIRVKYPYIRGVLLDFWREARTKYENPIEAYQSIVENKEKRARYQRARGKGGFRRAKWDELLELIAAANLYTIKKHGSDRIFGFSPIPAMSFLSYAAGSRFLQLLGGVNLSFYDWYCDLPPASPEIWGEQTDVCESADWYNSKFIAIMGSNLNMTRTPDCHFMAEARHNGTKIVVFSPDYSQVSKYADQWIAVKRGQDLAFWMSVNHVLLKEFHYDNKTPYFIDYVKQFTDCPFLVKLIKTEKGYSAGRELTAADLTQTKDIENANFKFLIYDENKKTPKIPNGTIGFRWGNIKGKWNLELKDALNGEPLNPLLTFINESDKEISVLFNEFENGGVKVRNVLAKEIDTVNGKIYVTTVYDLLFARFGVNRNLGGDYPKDYNDQDSSYTPAWQEKFTSISRETIIKFAREWAKTAISTGGKCSVIIGAGINHWYHNNLIYRSSICALMLCGCVGKNGGGLNHYVGQEKLAPMASWSTLAFARDWVMPPRLQNAPSWHYVNSSQWRYESKFSEYHTLEQNPLTDGHAVDLQIKAVRNGWLPFYPQFNKNNSTLVKEARKNGAKDEKGIIGYVTKELQSGGLKLSVEDPESEENWPRLWYIWRGNAIMSSAKGHEFFLKHYLGTHTNLIAEERAEGSAKDIVYQKAVTGKMDLVVDLNFRMDTSALYSDIVLPAATWYEKADLNSTDLHSFIHPLSAAVNPCWESKSDWEIFKAIAKKISEIASKYYPEREEDLIVSPLSHDTPDELAQSEIKEWSKGECDVIPGKTFGKLKVVERDYTKLYNRFISFGPLVKNGLGAHGVNFNASDFYDELLKSETHPVETVDGVSYPSLAMAEDAANVILHFAPETNGEIAYRAYKNMEEKVGLPLTDLALGNRNVRMTYKDLQSQPRRLLNSPCWSGLMSDGRAYSPFTYNVEKLVPWRTLSGRQHFYLDHEGYIAFSENLPIFKPTPLPKDYGDFRVTENTEATLSLNYLTPHGKWHIHSTYYDNHRMLTLSRGCEPLWINDKDALDVKIIDNDWVEVFNDNGVVCTRAAVSARIPRGVCIQYHSPERTLAIPKSILRNKRRAGGHNSLTRIRLKPVLMFGGYGQFTYHFNYWGPTGVNRDTYVKVRKLEKVIW